MMTMATAEKLAKLDADDPLSWTRGEFEIPSINECGGEGGESGEGHCSTANRYAPCCGPDRLLDGEAIYFCGNSLGLLSKRARQYVMEELDTWSKR
jgi:kynureninase